MWILNLLYKIRLLFLYYTKNITPKVIKYNKFELSFFDDFDGDKIDGYKWVKHFFWSDKNNKTQWASKDNFIVDKSILKIYTPTIPKHLKNKKITVSTAILHTGETFTQKYGRYQIRCKIPNNQNISTIFWLLSSLSDFPEIDIFYFLENKNGSYKTACIYGDNDSDQLYSISKKIVPIEKNNWIEFTLDWYPNKLIWYYNGYRVFIHKYKGIPQTPMYLLINTMVNLTNEYNNKEINTLEIDWVKIYKFKSEKFGG